jgi:16S rRNA (uracil1498-N3)-methyltransferase
LADLPFRDYELKLVAYEEAAKEGESHMFRQFTDKLLLEKRQQTPNLLAVFGPEGGISAAEIDFLQQQGCQSAGLGPRILRAETAPWYLLAALSFALELG